MVYKLLTPGPVQLPKEVVNAIARQPLFHRSKEFRELLENVLEKLRKVYNATPVIAPGTGTLAVDMAIYNFVNPGDIVVAIVHGEFGNRMAQTAESRGAKVYKLETKLYPPPPDVVEDYALRLGNVKAIIAVHNETSTGVVNRYLDKLQKVAQNIGAVLIVDSVSAIPVEPIDCKIDVIATATHKAFMAPPGGAIVYLNIEPKPRTPVPLSMDLKRFLEHLSRIDTPYTPPINVLYGLNASLDIILSMGLTNYQQLHRERAGFLYSSIKLRSVAEGVHRSNTVAAFYTDKASEIIERLRNQGYIIAGGLGELKGKIIRIGVMGDISMEDLRKVVDTVNMFVV
jgi:aspartate aminotransferase-like enzyme